MQNGASTEPKEYNADQDKELLPRVFQSPLQQICSELGLASSIANLTLDYCAHPWRHFFAEHYGLIYDRKKDEDHLIEAKRIISQIDDLLPKLQSLPTELPDDFTCKKELTETAANLPFEQFQKSPAVINFLACEYRKANDQNLKFLQKKLLVHCCDCVSFGLIQTLYFIINLQKHKGCYMAEDYYKKILEYSASTRREIFFVSY